MEFRELNKDEIDVRVQSVGKNNYGYYAIFLLYKDARCDMNILDETVGCMNWKRTHEVINNNLFCTVSIYNENTHEWVSKQDVGIESNMQKEKGQASDSFKRACTNWGIGRELYTSPFICVNLKDSEVKQAKQGQKPATYLKLFVSHIKYENKKIKELELEDEKGNLRYSNIRKVEFNTKEENKNFNKNNNDNVVLNQYNNEKAKFIFDYYKTNPNFGKVLKGILNGRKVTDLNENELDELINLINTSKNTLEG